MDNQVKKEIKQIYNLSVFLIGFCFFLFFLLFVIEREEIAGFSVTWTGIPIIILIAVFVMNKAKRLLR